MKRTPLPPSAIRPNRQLHDAAMRAAIDHQADLTEEELRTLNEVASAWTAMLEVPAGRIHTATAILRRFTAWPP